MTDGRFLYLLRHATAETGAGGDHARPLSPQGHEEARRLAETWPDWLPWPEHALCSDARRTQETLAALRSRRAVGQTETEAQLYLATAEAMLERLQLAPRTAQSLLLVGHNPGIHELALQLMEPGDGVLRRSLPRGFAPASLCALRLPPRMTWSDLAAQTATPCALYHSPGGWQRG